MLIFTMLEINVCNATKQSHIYKNRTTRNKIRNKICSTQSSMNVCGRGVGGGITLIRRIGDIHIDVIRMK